MGQRASCGACGTCKNASKPYFSSSVQVEEGDASTFELVRPEEVHALIVWTDYGADELTSLPGVADAGDGGRVMVQLMEKCGAAKVLEVPAKSTVNAMTKAINEMKTKCKKSDFLVFYYAGKGYSPCRSDIDGDENEVLCLVNDKGSVNQDTYLRADKLASLLTEVKCSRMLILMDCWHPGLVVDLGRDSWSAAGKKVVTISGCRKQDSVGTGRGGLLTDAIAEAANTMAEDGDVRFTVGAFYNQMIAEAGELRKQHQGEQNIMIQSIECEPMNLAWPLVYKSHG